MKRFLLIGFLFCTIGYAFAQTEDKPSREKLFKKSSLGLQYAGSVGFVSLGYYKQIVNDKWSLGLIYGYTPKSKGGPLSSLSLKIRYSPFKFKIYKSVYLEPFQTGIFLAKNFGKNLEAGWPNQYPSGYYWWTNSLRAHLFFSTQVSVNLNQGSFSKIALYLEANTNDLYMYSYFPNMKTMSPLDIFFLGIGTKFYLK